MDVLFVIDATGSMSHAIKAAHEKAEDLSFVLQGQNRDALFSFGCVCYRDPVDEPTDKHELFDFEPEIETLADFLSHVEADGGGDVPEDYVGALSLAFEHLSWRPDAKKAIIWIADAPAHGKLFCGRPNHQEEEPKLIPLIQKLAKDDFYFLGLSIHNGADTSFNAMKKIYIDAGGKKDFRIMSFSPDQGDEVQAIGKTMMDSCSGLINDALKDPIVV